MLMRACLSIALLATLPCFCQVVPAAAGDVPVGEEGTPMVTPPPVSGAAYPTATGNEMRSNYLRGGMTFETAYNNAVEYSTGNPSADVTYSIRPTIALDRTTTRVHQTLAYSPGFTFYQRMSAYNEQNQDFSYNLEYRMSEYLTFQMREFFDKSSSVFNQENPYAGATISGSTQSTVAGAIAPFADRMSNAVSGEVSYQVSANRMIGGGGTSTKLNYPTSSEVPGLCNSDSLGGSAFYNLRLSRSQYIGGTYQFSRFLSCPASTQSDTTTHAFNLFYTLYLRHALSISLLGGPEHYATAQAPNPSFASWAPSVAASVSWQAGRSSLAASYSRSVSAGGGLSGAFDSNGVNAHARWQLTRSWAIDLGGSYESNRNVDSLLALSNPGGHTASGTVLLQRKIGANTVVEAGYQRQHQRYRSIAAISALPDNNRAYVSVSYQFERPLGR